MIVDCATACEKAKDSAGIGQLKQSNEVRNGDRKDQQTNGHRDSISESKKAVSEACDVEK